MTLNANELQEERTSLAMERTRLAAERNRLANERTFLSWLRTALAIIGGGFALAHLIPFVHEIHRNIAYIAGIVMIFLGIGMFVLAIFDFKKSSKHIGAKGLPGSLGTVIAIVLILVSISLTLAFILIKEVLI